MTSSLAPSNKTSGVDDEYAVGAVPRETYKSIVKQVRPTGKTHEFKGILKQLGIITDNEYSGGSKAEGI